MTQSRARALAIVVVLVLLALWMRGAPATQDASSEHGERERTTRVGDLIYADGGRAEATGRSGDAGVPTEPPHGPRPPMVETPRTDMVVDPGAFDPGPGQDYMREYDGRSGRLSPNLRPGQTDVTTRLRSLGPAPRLVAWVPTIRIQAGAPAVIHAQLLDQAERPVAGANVTIAIGRLGHEPETITAMPAAPAGSAHQYELVFPTSTERPSDAPPNVPVEYDYRIVAAGTLDEQPYERTVVGSFMVHATPGAIDPSTLRVERDGTDIVLRFDVVIERDANFFGYAELWGGSDASSAIVFGQDRFVGMSPGRHAVTLRFGGHVIHDVGIDGPYVVRNVKWMQVDAIPPQETEPIPELDPTPPWSASEFR